MLILSFSPLAGDARVLKQIRHFAPLFDVTTCGYGPSPHPDVEHLEIPASAGVELDGRLITLRAYRAVHARVPAVRAARALLRSRRFDVAIANDVESVPVVLGVVPASRVLADLHEFSPRLHEESAAWMRRISPYLSWLCRRFVSRAGATTTVSDGLAREYEKQFGFRPQVVTNAAPFADLEPQVVGSPIRLVHSGAGLRNRNLMLMLDAVEATTTPVTLDLFLTANDPGYIAELRERAQTLPGVTVHDPVPYDRLIHVLNDYDTGVHMLPPSSFNNRWALPNKFFDYVQARLGLLIGPSPEMAAYVQRWGVGAVADDFTADALTARLDDLTPESVRAFKARSHEAAPVLAADTQIAIWAQTVDRLLEGAR
ncbi:glycosyltransferase family 1 protein [Oerskovia sp. Sa1BUA8]|uniref:Glycosyltransferase family 1 protein n=1 Tax=Oerskovia douganii TaxID=2762210 RepID=A0A9D5U6Q6_9CELL|nr:glycosyltransferase family 1 protein [Oerskovia douganii]MBE7699544.1 glycosyltransferase family 1 protein [Oerskovia douganii]